MSANLAERRVELGTLNAAGMSRGILGRLVATENLLLTVIGIPIGLVAGIGIARWFMSNYENLGYRWELRMQTSTLDSSSSPSSPRRSLASGAPGAGSNASTSWQSCASGRCEGEAEERYPKMWPV